MGTDKQKAQEYFEKGAALGQSQRWAEAITALKEAVKEDPDHAKAHMCLVMAYGATMDMDAARSHFAILKKLDPGLAKRVEDSPAGMMILRAGPVIRF